MLMTDKAGGCERDRTFPILRYVPTSFLFIYTNGRFVYSVVYDAVLFSEVMQHGMGSGRLVMNYERGRKPIYRHYPGSCLKVLSKTTKRSVRITIAHRRFAPITFRKRPTRFHVTTAHGKDVLL
jgi:hypothetical protein